MPASAERRAALGRGKRAWCVMFTESRRVSPFATMYTLHLFSFNERKLEKKRVREHAGVLTCVSRLLSPFCP